MVGLDICMCVISIALILLATPLLANISTKSFEPVFKPSLAIDKTTAGIKIDGDLGDTGWHFAGKVENFNERSPGDKTKPEVETMAYMTFNEDYLYVAFVCHDDPSQLRATMCQRDQFGSDDAVCLLIDTYGDASWAYELLVNPYGIQKDRLWSSVGGEDAGFDLIWESAAQITDSGYQVEMAIPFSSLRFPNRDTQNWKVDFWRNRPRDSFNQYSWAAYDRNEQCWVCQWGDVSGISHVKPGKGLEVLPTYIANQSGQQPGNQEVNFDPGKTFDNTGITGELSLNGKYTINSNVIAEGSYNPDFSQVEGDASQIDVNTTFALFYPERRPFFQEGSDLFRTLFNSFYTRTVNDPIYATKLTGRLDKGSFGFLSAYDENTPYIIPLDESSITINSGKSLVNSFRVLRSIGDDSQVGFIINDRRQDGVGSNTVVAVDHDIRLSRTLSIDGQYIYTHTTEPSASVLNGTDIYVFDSVYFDPDVGHKTAMFDGDSFSGTAMIARLQRNARSLNFNIGYNQVSPTYRTQTGYDPTINYRHVDLGATYVFYPENSLFEQISPNVYYNRRWDFKGRIRWGYTNFNLNGRIKYAQTNFGMSYYYGSQTFRETFFNGLWNAQAHLGSQPMDQIGYYVQFEYGRDFSRYSLIEGNQVSFYAEVELKPIDRILIEPNFSFVQFDLSNDNGVLYKGFITRTRIRYQANRELSMRLVVEYDDFEEEWNIAPLVTYRLSSFSVFYIGSTYNYNNLEIMGNGIEDTDPNYRPARSFWKLTSQQFFMKLQYLFQV